MSGFKIYREINASFIKTDALNINGVSITTPSANALGSRLFNETTYDTASVSSILNLVGANLSQPITNESRDAYRQQAFRIENANANRELESEVEWNSNGDEENIALFAGNFSKAMPHDAQGRVLGGDYIFFKAAIQNRDIERLGLVPMGGSRKFVQPLAGLTLNEYGCASSTLSLPAAPSFASAEAAGEMVECYCKSLCRDIPFVDFSGSVTVEDCVGYLNALSDYKGNNPNTEHIIFRGIGAGEINGPFISQIFFLDHNEWPNSVPAKIAFPTRTSANNRMMSAASYISVQNGNVPESDPAVSGTPTYLSTGRDLSYCVWKDDPGRWFERAAYRLLDLGASFVSPYPLANQQAFVTFTIVDLRACLHAVCQAALPGAWYGKWFVNRRARPEAFGNEVEQVRLGGENVTNLHTDILSSGVLADVAVLNGGTHYLSQAYPEGSPTHPSYPAGHAVFSGACATVVKAFFDDQWIFPNSYVPTSDGTSLVSTGDTLTLFGEINKLAGNIALGRDWAGVHYRSDGHQGILLGEQIAISVLKDWINRYPEDNVTFSLTGYMGNNITITPSTSYARTMV